MQTSHVAQNSITTAHPHRSKLQSFCCFRAYVATEACDRLFTSRDGPQMCSVGDFDGTNRVVHDVDEREIQRQLRNWRLRVNVREEWRSIAMNLK